MEERVNEKPLFGSTDSDQKTEFEPHRKKISDYFVHSESLLTQMTLESLANEIGVSQSSVYQFVKDWLFWVPKFKIDIARNSNYQPTFQNVNSVNGADDISPDDDSITIAKKSYKPIFIPSVTPHSS